MIVRKLAHNVYDVFTGSGWPVEEHNPNIEVGQWTRVRRYHWGIKGIAGAYLQRPVLHSVYAAILAAPYGSIENV